MSEKLSDVATTCGNCTSELILLYTYIALNLSLGECKIRFCYLIFSAAVFHTSEQNSVLRLLPVLLCARLQAWLRTWKEKHHTVLLDARFIQSLTCTQKGWKMSLMFCFSQLSSPALVVRVWNCRGSSSKWLPPLLQMMQILFLHGAILLLRKTTQT